MNLSDELVLGIIRVNQSVIYQR